MALVGDMNYLIIGSNTYEIADAEARNRDLEVTYTAGANDTPGDLTLSFTSVGDSDNEEF